MERTPYNRCSNILNPVFILAAPKSSYVAEHVKIISEIKTITEDHLKYLLIKEQTEQ